MSFERGDQLVKSLELLKPYLTLTALIEIRNWCSERSRSSPDPGNVVVAEMTNLLVNQIRKKNRLG